LVIDETGVSNLVSVTIKTFELILLKVSASEEIEYDPEDDLISNS
jgi:hypothetical protein